ncbi:MAG TPA: polyphosphate kinase 1 [Saprospiraceae bacterium]|nr:polyphosphate kinase 1 [Saprospiraceae bacterium]HMP23172.1 polyphosphate kinase 1 [Saprospiraceae bacterium]
MFSYEYFSRDVSWLMFNHRVLQEAKDPTVPLYERIKFLAIYSSNLDEFYRVRVASLRSFKELKKKTRRELLDLRPKKELKQIRRIVQQQQQEFGAIFRAEILPALEAQGIFIVRQEAYSSDQQRFARQYFFEKIYPHLHPIIVNETGELPFLENAALYFVVELVEERAIRAIVNIPSDKLPRFVVLPSEAGQYAVTFLDDLLRAGLPEIFQQPVAGAYAIKLSRDAELYIEDEYAGDLLEKIKKSLTKRDIGLPTRLLFDQEMPLPLLEWLTTRLDLNKDDLIPGARYHNFNDFFRFPNPTGNAQLHDTPLPPLPHPVLEGAPSLLEVLQKQDVLLHFPYQRFEYVPQLIREAANDPLVTTIKITLYRVAAKSSVIEALLQACQQQKQVVVFIEAKARFDEAANLHWGDALSAAGAQVFYSYPGIKVHAKLLLVSRQEAVLQHYAYIGTGNFNEKNAELYTDHALLTAAPYLANEVAQVFALLERKIIVPTCKQLLVAPFTLRQRFVEMIDREIAHAHAGKPARILLKMNSLEDHGMIDKLYRASQAGVQIRIIVRGICCLIPGVAGMSEHIEVISIIDRFLEHARVYVFANDGQEAVYLASADWMTRNLDRRVEVAVPVLDPALAAELRSLLELQWHDNTKARRIDASQDNNYRLALPLTPAQRAQTDIYRYLKQSSAAAVPLNAQQK